MNFGRCVIFSGELYTSDKTGNDATGDGSDTKPYKTILRAMQHAGKEPFPIIYVDSKEEGKEISPLVNLIKNQTPIPAISSPVYCGTDTDWCFVSPGSLVFQKYEPAAKSQLKKIQKIWVRDQHKTAGKEKREEEAAENRAKNVEEAKKIVIKEDQSLPKAKSIKVNAARQHRDVRVKIYGWVHRLRRQGEGVFLSPLEYHSLALDVGRQLIFITLRDGTDFLQCVLNDSLCQTYEALVLSTESAVQLFGVIKELPTGKNVGVLAIPPNFYSSITKVGVLAIPTNFYSSITKVGVLAIPPNFYSSITKVGVLAIPPNFYSSITKAPGGHEMQVDYWELVGLAPAGGADNILNEEAHADVLLDNRHIVIRGENVSSDHINLLSLIAVITAGGVQSRVRSSRSVLRPSYHSSINYVTLVSKYNLQNAVFQT
uniref:Uncharacterized protein n=1 Tax=Timema douglasi TaxID=61478 RepID=A0A7R8VXH2_TIMDO|nr:unnamed protein product [Timema douglasi]